jgi:hypothetical protein
MKLSFHFCDGGLPALIPLLAKLVGRGIDGRRWCWGFAAKLPLPASTRTLP